MGQMEGNKFAIRQRIRIKSRDYCVTASLYISNIWTEAERLCRQRKYCLMLKRLQCIFIINIIHYSEKSLKIIKRIFLKCLKIMYDPLDPIHCKIIKNKNKMRQMWQIQILNYSISALIVANGAKNQLLGR